MKGCARWQKVLGCAPNGVLEEEEEGGVRFQNRAAVEREAGGDRFQRKKSEKALGQQWLAVTRLRAAGLGLGRRARKRWPLAAR